MKNGYFDFIGIVPDDALETCGKEEKEYNPFSDTTHEIIANTSYIISVSCSGTEPILGKIKRLLFDAPLREKEEDCT